jgi:hypothetical protein
MLTVRISLAVLLIVGTGLIDGVWTNRWHPSSELAALTAKFDSIPMVVGDWHGAAFEIPAKERAIAGAAACFARKYSNPASGVTLSVVLLGGLPGDLANHAPTICYPGAGYTLSAPAPISCRYGKGEKRAVLQTALAARGGVSPSVLRILWGWNAAKGWAAPDEPRWSFASERYLCKLYVLRETFGSDVKAEDDPCTNFLAVFLPEVDRRVFDFAK